MANTIPNSVLTLVTSQDLGSCMCKIKLNFKLEGILLSNYEVQLKENWRQVAKKTLEVRQLQALVEHGRIVFLDKA